MLVPNQFATIQYNHSEWEVNFQFPNAKHHTKSPDSKASTERPHNEVNAERPHNETNAKWPYETTRTQNQHREARKTIELCRAQTSWRQQSLCGEIACLQLPRVANISSRDVAIVMNTGELSNPFLVHHHPPETETCHGNIGKP